MTLPSTTRPPDDPRNGPLTLRRDLLRTGMDDREIRRLIRSGDFVQVRPGAYIDRAVWTALNEEGRFGLRGRAVLRQARTPLILSHTSSVVEWGLPSFGFDLTQVHTTRTDGLSGRRAADVRQHEARVGPGDLVVVNGVPVTNPARAVLEACTLVGPECGLCVVNAVLNKGLITETQLLTQYVGMENWPHSRAIEIVLRLCDGRIESVGESRTFWVCYLHSLPMPVPQYEITDPSGQVVARVDFAWPDLGVYLEFDGRIKYEKLLRPGERASDVVWREKKREQMIGRLTGWRCIRITWADLADPRRLAALILSALYPNTAAS